MLTACTPVTAVQTEYSLFERGIEANLRAGDGARPWHRAGAVLAAGRGFLTGQLKLDQLDATDFRNGDPRLQGDNLDANLRIVQAISTIAKSKGVAASQLAIAWTIAQGGVPIQEPAACATSRRTSPQPRSH